MIRKSGNRFSEKIMLNQRDETMMRFLVVASWSSAVGAVDWLVFYSGRSVVAGLAYSAFEPFDREGLLVGFGRRLRGRADVGGSRKKRAQQVATCFSTNAGVNGD